MSSQLMDFAKDSTINNETQLLFQYAENIRPASFSTISHEAHSKVPLRLQELMNLVCDAIDEPLSRSELAFETANLLVELQDQTCNR